MMHDSGETRVRASICAIIGSSSLPLIIIVDVIHDLNVKDGDEAEARRGSRNETARSARSNETPRCVPPYKVSMTWPRTRELGMSLRLMMKHSCDKHCVAPTSTDHSSLLRSQCVYVYSVLSGQCWQPSSSSYAVPQCRRPPSISLPCRLHRTRPRLAMPRAPATGEAPTSRAPCQTCRPPQQEAS